jgi:hypothetical protein
MTDKQSICEQGQGHIAGPNGKCPNCGLFVGYPRPLVRAREPWFPKPPPIVTAADYWTRRIFRAIEGVVVGVGGIWLIWHIHW